MAEIFDLVTGAASFAGNGPRYVQLKRLIEQAIRSGTIKPGEALPPEREIATRAGLSRVTVRKAVQELVREGALFQRHGSGTFITPRVGRVEQSLSALTSFTEDMARRGINVTSVWLDRGIYLPRRRSSSPSASPRASWSPASAGLRSGNGEPLAIERASLSAETLPDPASVGASLYDALEQTGKRPVRAIQRISASLLSEADAALLGVPAGSAGLNIARTSYQASGKVVEFTRSIYRADAYDFVAELRLSPPDLYRWKA